jgi:hypothetical protein
MQSANGLDLLLQRQVREGEEISSPERAAGFVPHAIASNPG